MFLRLLFYPSRRMYKFDTQIEAIQFSDKYCGRTMSGKDFYIVVI